MLPQANMVMIHRRVTCSAVMLLLLELALLGQAEYRYERRPSPGQQLVYEMRMRTEGAFGELVARLRLNAINREGLAEEQVDCFPSATRRREHAISALRRITCWRIHEPSSLPRAQVMMPTSSAWSLIFIRCSLR
jgi:hypothetical protein